MKFAIFWKFIVLILTIKYLKPYDRLFCEIQVSPNIPFTYFLFIGLFFNFSQHWNFKFQDLTPKILEICLFLEVKVLILTIKYLKHYDRLFCEIQVSPNIPFTYFLFIGFFFNYSQHWNFKFQDLTPKILEICLFLEVKVLILKIKYLNPYDRLFCEIQVSPNIPFTYFLFISFFFNYSQHWNFKFQDLTPKILEICLFLEVKVLILKIKYLNPYDRLFCEIQVSLNIPFTYFLFIDFFFNFSQHSNFKFQDLTPKILEICLFLEVKVLILTIKYLKHYDRLFCEIQVSLNIPFTYFLFISFFFNFSQHWNFKFQDLTPKILEICLFLEVKVLILSNKVFKPLRSSFL